MRAVFINRDTVNPFIAPDLSLDFNEKSGQGVNDTNYADLYVLGKIWLKGLKTALLGSNLNIIPTVSAIEPPPPPKKPPPMKYQDLPLYKSPHTEYKEYAEEKSRCPDANVKLVRRLLLPYVIICRKQVQESTCKIRVASEEYCHNVCSSINESMNSFKTYMRDAENENIRKAVVAGGAGAGYLLGSGKGVTRRLLLMLLGAAFGGALCYPKETDEAVRTYTYYTGKGALGVLNWTCGKDFSWRERIPCKDDMPSDMCKVVPQCTSKK